MALVANEKKNSFYLYIFLAVFSLFGLVTGFMLIAQYVGDKLIIPTNDREIPDFLTLLFIMCICRSLPLPSKKREGFDISIITIFAAFLIKGPGATMLMIVISAFFTFARWDGKKVNHIFNTPLSKTLFNNVNLIVSVYFGWLAFECVYPSYKYDLRVPDVIVPSVLFLLVFLLVNCLFMALLFKIIDGMPFIRNLIYGYMSLIPNMMVLAPLGYFMAMLIGMKDGGPYVALLLFLPMVFARYAFKLYLKSQEQYLKTISTLTAAIEAKDKYTEGHSKRVEEYSVMIAQEMKMQSNRIDNIKVAAVLHDIGKIGIDDEILRKPSKLNEEEWSRIMQHPSIGIRILEEIEMPQAVKDMIQYHHVRFDLKGYPMSDIYKEIPMEVHIISLADAYDAMTSNRPYRPAMAEEVALQNILDGKGTQFHPAVVDAFFKMKKRG